MAFLLEETKGVLPTWLAPLQVKILPIADSHVEYAKKIKEELMLNGIRAKLDDRNEKIGYKIREAQLEKVPYMLIIGNKEVENNQVGVRSHKDGDIGAMNTKEFVEKIVYEVKNYIK